MNNDLINNNKYKDITGLHQQEQIPVNPKAIAQRRLCLTEMMANFFQGLKGGRK